MSVGRERNIHCPYRGSIISVGRAFYGPILRSQGQISGCIGAGKKLPLITKQEIIRKIFPGDAEPKTPKIKKIVFTESK